MHIFIDESGTFVLPSTANNVSLVGALVIPDRRLPYIEKRYSKIRSRLPKEKGEVKGRLMGESDIDLVVSMLAEQQVLFEACAIDLGTHSLEDLAWHKSQQEDGMTKNVTEDFSPELKEDIFALRHRLAWMKRSEIRGRLLDTTILDCAALHPSYDCAVADRLAPRELRAWCSSCPRLRASYPSTFEREANSLSAARTNPIPKIATAVTLTRRNMSAAKIRAKPGHRPKAFATTPD